MKCSEVALLLDEYSSNELPTADVLVVATHLSDCATCRLSLQESGATNDRIRALPSETAAGDFLPRLRARIASERPGLSRKQTAPVASLPEDTAVGDGVSASATQMGSLRLAGIAA